MDKSNIGIYGLGVMGQNLTLNFNDHDYAVSVFNPRLPGEETVLDDFLTGAAADTDIRGYAKVRDFVQSLAPPRKILLMVKAGDPVDSVIGQLQPLLDEGDILIDGGNTYYPDTNRRLQELAQTGIRYVGMGVSGGEKGARQGPSLMPGGDKEAWPHLKPLLEPVAASADDGTPCCAWMGPEGAGHFVKMVHNGIEYAIMQLIAECYQLMKSGLKMSNEEIARTFEAWNEGPLSSYLIEITADIFTVRDEGPDFLIDQILDKAGQKGTGRWTAITGLELGVPLSLITEAVFARTMSSFKDLRQQASASLGADLDDSEVKATKEDLRQALIGGQLVAFAEGFWLLQAARSEFEWDIPLDRVAETWRAGCIIRSAVLEPIARSYHEQPDLPHLLLAPAWQHTLQAVQSGWRSAVGAAMQHGVPVPALTAALAHFDGLRTSRLPANLIQAQRDYFGAHKYERVDKPGGQLFHTDWQKNINEE